MKDWCTFGAKRCGCGPFPPREPGTETLQSMPVAIRFIFDQSLNITPKKTLQYSLGLICETGVSHKTDWRDLQE